VTEKCNGVTAKGKQCGRNGQWEYSGRFYCFQHNPKRRQEFSKPPKTAEAMEGPLSELMMAIISRLYNLDDEYIHPDLLPLVKEYREKKNGDEKC
jgi:hypothetical protein